MVIIIIFIMSYCTGTVVTDNNKTFYYDNKLMTNIIIFIDNML